MTNLHPTVVSQNRIQTLAILTKKSWPLGSGINQVKSEGIKMIKKLLIKVSNAQMAQTRPAIFLNSCIITNQVANLWGQFHF